MIDSVLGDEDMSPAIADKYQILYKLVSYDKGDIAKPTEKLNSLIANEGDDIVQHCVSYNDVPHTTILAKPDKKDTYRIKYSIHFIYGLHIMFLLLSDYIIIRG